VAQDRNDTGPDAVGNLAPRFCPTDATDERQTSFRSTIFRIDFRHDGVNMTACVFRETRFYAPPVLLRIRPVVLTPWAVPPRGV